MHAHAVVRSAMRAPLRAVGVSWFSLVASGTAFAVCALPAAWVALGGNTEPSFMQTPLFVLGAAYRETAFALSAALLVMAAWTLWNSSARYLPPDPQQAREYRRLRHWNRWVLRISAALWLIGIIAAYVVPPLGLLLFA
jgi:hypothetical protein